MTRIGCCLVLALVVPLASLGAQQTPPLAVGARVRVRVPKPGCYYPDAAYCYRTVVGSLAFIDSATIVVEDENGDTVDVSRAPGTRVAVSTGRSACGSCIAVGFVGGAGLGALFGWISIQSQGGASRCGENLCEGVYWFAVPGGAVLGAIIGAVHKSEHWTDVELPVRLGVGPVGRGFAVGLSIAF